MMSSQRDTLIHLVSGGVAGTAGAVVTCPLEVVKTRLQSSNPTFGDTTYYNGGSGNGSSGSSSSRINHHDHNTSPHHRRHHTLASDRGHMSMRSRYISTCMNCGRNSQMLTVPRPGIPPNPMLSASPVPHPSMPKLGLMQCLRLIIEKEGPRALFKGLGPNIVGVAPSRAIYFCSYSQAKKTFNQMFPPDSPIVHIFSAATAGFVSCTATNPVWFVKTRLQLDQNRTQSISETIRKIYRQGGILGFYKGISASYMGISETVIHFVIYEAVKKRLYEWSRSNETLADAERNPDDKTTKDFFQFMAAGAISKTVASVVAYPHEVARTRLREEGSKYKSFWQTLSLVAQEEGWRGVYRGLGTQLIRQIPNTAIMMSTYEATVYLFTKYLPPISDPNMIMSNVDLLKSDDGYDVTFEVDSADAAAAQARH